MAADSKSASSLRSLPQLPLNFLFNIGCFVVDLSIYRCILKSNCLSFFVMNRENFKQAFFHQLMCFLSAFNFVVILNFHVIRHVIMSFDKKS